jgi:hypothetical protein
MFNRIFFYGRDSIYAYIVFVMFFSGTVVLGVEIDYKTAMQIIRMKEKAVQTYSYKCKIDHPDTGETGSVSCVISLDGRYRAGIEHRVPKNDQDGFVEYTFTKAFDGHLFREQIDHNNSKKIISRGIVDNKNIINARDCPVLSTSLSCLFPFFLFPNNGKTLRFSEFLEEKHTAGFNVHIEEKETGEWIISTVDQNNVFHNKKGTQEVLSYFEIVFLPSLGKSGMIKNVLVGFRSENSENIDKKMGMWTEIVVESQQLGDYFVPQVVTLAEKPVLDEPEEIFGKYTYSEFEVNVPIDTSTFNIDWRKGTKVIDYHSQKSYVVGGSPADEAEAMRAFLRYQGIESPPVIPKRNNYIRIIVGGIGVLLILWGIYSMFRKRKSPHN